jgi:TolB-like protein/Flp pilus assembly protein TadD
MLAGRPPFEGSNARAVIASHVVKAVPPLSTACPNLPQNVVYAVTRALAKSPDDRFDTIRDFAEALATPDAQERSDGPSIAVLPFSDLSDSKGHEYLSDGIAEEIILALTRIEGLRVASRAASFAFKDTQQNVRAIGEQLHVRTILEGSVRPAGDRLRITAELINAADGYQLWTRRYDRGVAEVFAIQEEIAENIARTLQVILSKGKKNARNSPPTADVTAYDYYLRGKQYLHHGTKKSYDFARQMFERAAESDPDFARAHAGIANCYSLLVHYYGDPTDGNLKRADAASREAIRLDPNLADGHAARGFVLWLMDRPDDARRAFETAIELDPVLGDARYLYGRACYQQGQLDDAVRLFEEACRIREDYEARYFAAQTYTALGRDADAEEGYRRALRATEDHLTLNPDDARALTMGAVAWCRIGQRAKGLEWAERALAAEPEDAGVRYNVACLYALEGESDKAIACLEAAVQAGFAHKDWVDNDPDLDSLRDDPRFKTLAWRA